MNKNDAFKQEVREWLSKNCPPSLCEKGASRGAGLSTRYLKGDSRLWLERMGEKGWTAPMWPKEYGGGGLSFAENLIFRKEIKRINAPQALSGMGLSMIGPTLLELGTEEQKQRHIPKIVTGEVNWCQGYSEPNAGSDLANVQTKAEDKGDHYLINGSKIWTSGAMNADWMFCLVRTDNSVQKQKGISFVLFPMTDPGVTRKPIKLISGNSLFCQVFFDNVIAEKRDLVGKVNDGWTVGKRLLQFERSSIGSSRIGIGSAVKSGLVDLAKKYRANEAGEIEDPLLRAQIVRHEMNSLAFMDTTQRIAEEAKAGKGLGFATSVMKYYASEMTKKKSELMVSILGPNGLGREGDEFSKEELAISERWLSDKAFTIAGGSSEVQLNIIAKRILQLPEAQGNK
ncbi:MAG: acyl-CoA dehydrogenase family protein [Pseudomonadales bacterium]|nr:acyl-CoA dehydrogenase family protein [Pseudomonadales bacterium]